MSSRPAYLPMKHGYCSQAGRRLLSSPRRHLPHVGKCTLLCDFEMVRQQPEREKLRSGNGAEVKVIFFHLKGGKVGRKVGLPPFEFGMVRAKRGADGAEEVCRVHTMFFHQLVHDLSVEAGDEAAPAGVGDGERLGLGVVKEGCLAVGVADQQGLSAFLGDHGISRRFGGDLFDEGGVDLLQAMDRFIKERLAAVLPENPMKKLGAVK